MYRKLKDWFRREMSHRYGWSADGRNWRKIVRAHEKGQR